jgi:hypothetical protein
MIRQNNSLMQQYFHPDNFDLSIILPFYKRLDDFKIILPRNAHYFERNGIEVIIVMDEPSEKVALLEFIKRYPFINWRIITNYKLHKSRNPAKVINVGIRHAIKKYIMVCSPETEFYTDIVLQLRELLEYYPNHFATGYVAFVDFDMQPTDETIKLLSFMNYGSIMVERRHIENVGGYDEDYDKWGGEDDNIRARLEIAGIRKLKDPGAIALHREKELKLKERLIKTANMPQATYLKSYLPASPLSNARNNWGTDFDTIEYDWKKNKYSKELCNKYIKQFIQHKIIDPNIFSHEYDKIILCQSYNELEMLDGFLENMSQYFDGIILLDDESTDGTYEHATHEKLLLKVQKKRLCFNDLENRTILLDLASFFHSRWFCFMDIDERFDNRFADFSFTSINNCDVAIFRIVHLWDSKKYYNSEYPYSNKGIQQRIRMFRNIGRMQIVTEKTKLHFPATPYWSRPFYSNTLILHYGLLDKEKRLKKYHFYLHEDTEKDQTNYKHFLSEPNLLSLKSLER